jgi:hypothetical protein
VGNHLQTPAALAAPGAGESSGTARARRWWGAAPANPAGQSHRRELAAGQRPRDHGTGYAGHGGPAIASAARRASGHSNAPEATARGRLGGSWLPSASLGGHSNAPASAAREVLGGSWLPSAGGRACGTWGVRYTGLSLCLRGRPPHIPTDPRRYSPQGTGTCARERLFRQMFYVHIYQRLPPATEPRAGSAGAGRRWPPEPGCCPGVPRWRDPAARRLPVLPCCSRDALLLSCATLLPGRPLVLPCR